MCLLFAWNALFCPLIRSHICTNRFESIFVFRGKQDICCSLNLHCLHVLSSCYSKHVAFKPLNSLIKPGQNVRKQQMICKHKTIGIKTERFRKGRFSERANEYISLLANQSMAAAAEPVAVAAALAAAALSSRL